MSTAYYFRCLAYHEGSGGIAKEGPLELRLTTPPPIAAGITDIEYGEVHDGCLAFDPYIRQLLDGQQRDLTKEELTAVRAWLAGLLTAVQAAALNGPVVH